MCAPSANGGTEGRSRVSLHWPPWSRPKRSQLHVLGNHLWRMLGLRVWPGNKANVLPVKHIIIIISSTEESAVGEVQYQDHVPLLPQPPYSPDLAPCDFFLYPQLKKTMKGRWFDYIEDIQANAMRQLRAITKSDYYRCFRQWQEHWSKFIQAQRHYFEGDKTN